MFGVDLDTRIFDPNFIMPKSMLLEELEKDMPSKMCGWKNSFVDSFIEKDGQVLFKWPYLQKLLKSD